MTMSNKKCIKVALVDPFEQKVVYQTIPTDSHGSILGGVKLEIDCSLIDIVTLSDKHMVIIDDEGLYREDTRYSLLPMYPQPLAGKVVVCNYDEEGNTTDIDDDMYDELDSYTKFMHEGFSVEPRFEFMPLPTGKELN